MIIGKAQNHQYTFGNEYAVMKRLLQASWILSLNYILLLLARSPRLTCSTLSVGSCLTSWVRLVMGIPVLSKTCDGLHGYPSHIMRPHPYWTPCVAISVLRPCKVTVTCSNIHCTVYWDCISHFLYFHSLPQGLQGDEVLVAGINTGTAKV